jgi:predicted solute-binding protein
MWMTRENAGPQIPDFAIARDEGVAKIEEIVSEYASQTQLAPEAIRDYLNRNIVFRIDEDLRQGMQLYFQLAHKHGLTRQMKPLRFL